ncbi:MAG: flagellin [Verrucomicrobia bacterium]|nr:flagellin [Verrucomicrobiota bacterium]
MAVIGTNPASLNASFFLNRADMGLTKSIKRLSSGSRLSDPSDDAAGVSVSGKLTSSTARLAAATEGAQNLISFAQVADGFLGVIQNQITRMSELAIRATNGAFSSSDRANYSTEFEKLTQTISAQVTNAKFNAASVFQTGTVATTVTVAVNADGSNVYSMSLQDVRDTAGGVLEGMNAADIRTTSGASAAIATLSSAIERVATARAQVNTDVSVLNFYIQAISVEKINTETANSRIKDLDFATESTELAKNNIILQSATAMLAQANTSQQAVLALLQG